jgi:hypothetical protein
MKNASGQEVFSHEEKASFLWEAYKDRFGSSEFSKIPIDLNALLQPVGDLDDLIAPFSPEEIDNVIKDHKNDKSPGPDWFNIDFMKKCWLVIQQDFYYLCSSFYEHNICLQSINNSYITLIPKVDNPATVSNFRPISLLNSSVKLLTKLLANQLQKVILWAILQNEYGFLKSRSIQDCLAWSFEYLHLCHRSKKQLVILKLDFEKDFDKVEHDIILKVLQHKRFPGKMDSLGNKIFIICHLFYFVKWSARKGVPLQQRTEAVRSSIPFTLCSTC